MQIEDRKEQILSLFKYIRELFNLRYKIVTKIDDHKMWKQTILDLPEDPKNIDFHYFDSTDDDNSNYSLPILKVKKVDLDPCPSLPEEISKWIEPGWDDYRQEVRIKNTIQVENEIGGHIEFFENFTESEARVASYDIWKNKRDAWVEIQKIKGRPRQLFNELFNVYTRLNRESETIELLVGSGMIKTKDGQVNHPVLLKRVYISFEAEKNVITIEDTDREPELYTLGINKIENINNAAVQELAEELINEQYHPLDRVRTPVFLKKVVQTLSPEGRYVSSDILSASPDDRIIMSYDPVIFLRRRIDGTIKAIEEISMNIEETGFIPDHLVDLMQGPETLLDDPDFELSFEEELAQLNGESTDILLAKEANKEQLQIAQRIERNNAVLVQGPPGTGKTHTIANLMGHFLAQGKSVLVTSHTKKALHVLKDKLPHDIRDLCVSILDDRNEDMNKAIDGISEHINVNPSYRLKEQIKVLERTREITIKDLTDVRKKIFAIRNKEFKPIEYNGKSYSPREIAELINLNADKLSLIPGEITPGAPIPVSTEELNTLYSFNNSFNENGSDLEEQTYSNVDLLISPEDLEKVTAKRRVSSKVVETAEELNIKVFINNKDKELGDYIFYANDEKTIVIKNPKIEKIYKIENKIAEINGYDLWVKKAINDGAIGRAYRKQWEALIDLVYDVIDLDDYLLEQKLYKELELGQELTSDDVKKLRVLESKLQKNKELTKVDLLLMNKSISTLYSNIKINNNYMSSVDDAIFVEKHIQFRQKSQRLAELWNSLIAKDDEGISYENLGENPIQEAKKYANNIERLLNWHNTEYEELISDMNEAGFNVDYIFNTDNTNYDISHAFDVLENKMELYIELSKNVYDYIDNKILWEKYNEFLNDLELNNKLKYLEISKLVGEELVTAYGNLFNKSMRSRDLKNKLEERDQILVKIDAVAPGWARAIRNKESVHAKSKYPENIESAWELKQLGYILDGIEEEPLEEYESKSKKLSLEYRRITEKLASSMAWYKLALNIEADRSLGQALQSWKLTMRKIGKGTGKNAPRYKREARNLMPKCQKAVPAWIMTVNKALESLNPKENRFDVVIIDEASQSDISALGILYYGKKVIVVGDDMQVSPAAIGIDVNKTNALIETHIKNKVPYDYLYEAKTSLYDIVSIAFPSLMLREHFRCLPEIIGYSNKLSYDYKIKPLRDSGSSKIYPPVVNHRVAHGFREELARINSNEADEIVALIQACIEQPEYEGMTFGVISLLGDEQANLIQDKIQEKLDTSVIEKRQILCGNASQFQGDERDVIFLSMVDSSDEKGPLKLRSNDTDRQRYNVAASRAKDQLWVVHSLDHTRDLKAGDIRKGLLEYAEDPMSYAIKLSEIEKKSESPFEEEVAKSLVAANYKITQQWNVGSYRLDMVAEYEGKKVAIECDGEAYHSTDEQIKNDMERQTVLERIGWDFIRIRGSEYYRDKERTITRVKQDLAKLDIYPWQEKNTEPKEEQWEMDGPLLSRVKSSAYFITSENDRTI